MELFIFAGLLITLLLTGLAIFAAGISVGSLNPRPRDPRPGYVWDFLSEFVSVLFTRWFFLRCALNACPHYPVMRNGRLIHRCTNCKLARN